MTKGKLIGLDYGTVRTGIAITDDLRIIASPLTTVSTSEIMKYLETLIKREHVTGIILGEARHLDNTASDITVKQEKFAAQLRKKFPEVPVFRIDEMFTSKMAFQAMITAGLKKSDRAKKENLDKVSAAIILQSYLEQQSGRGF